MFLASGTPVSYGGKPSLRTQRVNCEPELLGDKHSIEMLDKLND